jgi:alpha-tubulin suppressor-like RCC1 family protein
MTGRRWYSPLVLASLVSLILSCGDSTGPAEASLLRSLSAGDDHGCLLLESGALHCWGWGALGQLGPGDTFDYNVPIKVTGALRFRSVSAGSAHTCGLLENGTAYCWGGNAVGALGNPSAIFKSKIPVKVEGGLRFQSISAGTGYTCGVATDNTGYCWGSGTDGELGSGNRQDEFVPVEVSGGLQFTRISTSLFHTCGLTIGGTAYCWGDNLNGKLGNGTLNSSTVPVAVLGGHQFKTIGTGDYFSCGLTPEGQAWCWGSNVSFELGNGQTATIYEDEPVPVYGVIRFEALAVGSYHACGLTVSRKLYCWGANTYGKLGTGVENPTAIPVQVIGDHEFVGVAAGGNHTCAITRDEGAFCWGWNRLGQLGIGSRTTKFAPVQVTESYLEP